nr:hypothetical protein [uncultured Halomonas sp.]
MATYLFLFLILASTLGLIVLVGLRYKFLVPFVLLAFFFRLGLIFSEYIGIFSIPGGGADARMFTLRALDMSRLPWSELMTKFEPGSAFVYSFYGSVFFKIFGYHPLILPFLNLMAGTLVVIVISVTSYNIWNKKAAQGTALLMALYPFTAFNSAIALREEFSILAFVCGVYFLVRWLQGKSNVAVVLSLVFFAIATTYHGGWVAAIVGLGIYFVLILAKAVPKLANGERVTKNFFGKVITSSVMLVLVMAIAASGVSLGKGIAVGTSESGGFTEMVESRFEGDPRGGSAYPGPIASGNPFTQPWLIPARIIYFLYAPFPWDLKSPRHLFGLVAAFLYFFLSWRVFKGWKDIKRKPECLALLIILVTLTFVFAIGVTNIGTALRHKTKFVSLFILLAASSFDTLKIKLRK